MLHLHWAVVPNCVVCHRIIRTAGESEGVGAQAASRALASQTLPRLRRLASIHASVLIPGMVTVHPSVHKLEVQYN